MYSGWPSLCLNVRDLDAATRFYEALGMEALPNVSFEGKRVVIRSGAFRLGLFKGIGTNLLNFRGADVRAVHEELKARFPVLAGTPEAYPANPGDGADHGGWCWTTHDPDGNVLLFDTNESEEGEAFRMRRISGVLRDVEHELVALGASAECLEVFRTRLVDRFCVAEE